MEGKIVYTVATTDAVEKLEDAKESGDFSYEYGIAPVPDINEELLTRSLSVTNCIVIMVIRKNRNWQRTLRSF